MTKGDMPKRLRSPRHTVNAEGPHRARDRTPTWVRAGPWRAGLDRTFCRCIRTTKARRVAGDGAWREPYEDDWRSDASKLLLRWRGRRAGSGTGRLVPSAECLRSVWGFQFTKSTVSLPEPSCCGLAAACGRAPATARSQRRRQPKAMAARAPQTTSSGRRDSFAPGRPSARLEAPEAPVRGWAPAFGAAPPRRSRGSSPPCCT
mmetsp:Transcript_32466/g.85746  ORF Transcript_32466/g.85746 Transcript_32466/m.85746 type:complete len:204 (+) Transcript_32466:117-728(+)